MPAYKVTIVPISAEMTITTETVVKGAVKDPNKHNVILLPAATTPAQIQGVLNYLGLIDAGAVTTTVETAITALAP